MRSYRSWPTPKHRPSLTRADLIPEKYRHAVTYFKAALGLRLLRDEILGPERFDLGFSQIHRRLGLQAPEAERLLSVPWRARAARISPGGGEAGSWRTGNSISPSPAAAYTDGDPRKGASVTLETHDKLVAPSSVEVRYDDGTTRRLALPVETWLLGGKAVMHLDGGPPILSVTVDPDHRLPDRDRANDAFVMAPPP